MMLITKIMQLCCRDLIKKLLVQDRTKRLGNMKVRTLLSDIALLFGDFNSSTSKGFSHCCDAVFV